MLYSSPYICMFRTSMLKTGGVSVSSTAPVTARSILSANSGITMFIFRITVSTDTIYSRVITITILHRAMICTGITMINMITTISATIRLKISRIRIFAVTMTSMTGMTLMTGGAVKSTMTRFAH